MNRFFRQRRMPGSSVGVIVIRETKYEACSRSRLRSSRPCLRACAERFGDVELVVVAEAGGQMDDLEEAVAEHLDRAPVERSRRAGC